MTPSGVNRVRVDCTHLLSGDFIEHNSRDGVRRWAFLDAQTEGEIHLAKATHAASTPVAAAVGRGGWRYNLPLAEPDERARRAFHQK
jgi:hypothetical protein